MSKRLFANIASIKEKVTNSNSQFNVFDIKKEKNKANQSYDFTEHQAYKELKYARGKSDQFGIINPLYRQYKGIGSNTIQYHDQILINYASYNYLGLNGHPLIKKAVIEAITNEGTSVSASRIVAGQRPLHQKLEEKLAKLYKKEAAISFVSGHATNVSVISCLMQKNALILYDQLSHNSILQGVKLSQGNAISFRHNDCEHLASLLRINKAKYKQILIVIEGLYSMDGDIAPLDKIIELKKEYGAILMVDEAHSLGVLGENGYGIFEHFHLNPNEVDIWMGTLSKTLSSCGGYIAANEIIIDLLRYYAPGLVYSVGLSPSNTAAALTALELLLQSPKQTKKVQQNSEYFLSLLKNENFNTGDAIGRGIVTVIVGSSKKAVIFSNYLFEKHQINAMPIMYPAVEEAKARLRFFISSEHTKKQLEETVSALKSFK